MTEWGKMCENDGAEKNDGKTNRMKRTKEKLVTMKTAVGKKAGDKTEERQDHLKKARERRSRECERVERAKKPRERRRRESEGAIRQGQR